ncbi:MAG: glycosyltransferase family 4 protein [Deltaproteobacteria bacterium]|nr:glycosyltransferase family 4 protein [Deltaproteobacteria bacterium]
MKILAALTYYRPHWTGLTVVAARVAEGMAARGHQVTVLTSHYDARLPRQETCNGVRVVRLPILGRLSRGVVMPSFPVAAWRLLADADALQVHTPMLEAPLLVRLARRRGVRAVLTHHGDLVMPGGLFNRAVERGVTALLRDAFRHGDAAAVYTRDYLDHSRFLAPFAARCVPIAPPVAMPAPDAAAARRWREELGAGAAPLVGFAGRFVEEKGFDFLLRAIPRVVAACPGTRFAYAGDRDVAYEDFFGACRDLIAPVAPHLDWLGLIRDPQRLADFYAMCDVIAVPSRTDNLPLVPLEAMLCGTPAVIADIPGARMAVRWTGMGTLVAPRDAEALAAGLIAVLREPARYVAPPAEVARVLDLDAALDAYEQLLRG